MIIEFTVKNFRSFKDAATLSLEAAPLRSGKVDVIKTEIGGLLPTVGIFGPNASGKSNLIKALSFMQSSVRNTDALNKPTTDHGLLKPFLLNSKSAKEPSFFQVVLWDNRESIEYRYGFEINSEEVIGEWLDITSRDTTQRRTRTIFRRDKQNFDIHRSMIKDLRSRSEQVPRSILALASFANSNFEIAMKIVDLLGEPNLYIFDGANMLNLERILDRCRKDVQFKAKILDFVGKAGLGIKDLVINEVKIPKDVLKMFPPEMKKLLKENGQNLDTTLLMSTGHRVYDDSHKVTDMANFDLKRDESLGSQQFLALSAIVLETLERGSVLVLDELGASLHPFLTSEIVNLFQKHKHNKKGAQLIFSSHDTYILSKNIDLRRDQIWFTDIDFYEESSLHSLVEYKVRNDIEVEKNYLEGRFGALPVTRFKD